MDPLVVIRSLTVNLRGQGSTTPVLEDVHLTLRRGKVTALTGPSGSGKSTIAQLLLGIWPQGMYQRVSGEILWHGARGSENLMALSGRQRRHFWQGGIGAIFQEPDAAFNPVRSLSAHWADWGASSGESSQRLEMLFSRMGIDAGEWKDRFPWQLSGGQQQRILLAMVMSRQPALLIADEPTASLDRHHQRSFLELLKAYAGQDMRPSVLLITHDRESAATVADEWVALENGRILASGSPASEPVSPTRRQRQELPDSPPVLHVTHLQGGYQKGKPAIRVPPFSLRPGEILGVAGASGSGKSSLLRALSGLLPWQDVRLQVAAKDIPPEEMNRHFALVYQDPGRTFNPALTIGEAFDEITRFRQVEGPDPRQVLEWVSLSGEMLQRRPHQFSGGQIQRLAMARALLCHPSVLLLDEPFSRLDASLRESFLDLVASVCASRNLPAILVSHDLPALAQWCHRLWIVRDGTVCFEGDVRELEESQDPYVISLRA